MPKVAAATPTVTVTVQVPSRVLPEPARASFPVQIVGTVILVVLLVALAAWIGRRIARKLRTAETAESAKPELPLAEPVTEDAKPEAQTTIHADRTERIEFMS
ncbi:hypothetical protein [Nonomuraea rubra]|uniref:hypothetical protein n=1 Tax=Nonomuraea rubra TaxID=46180 RepID=UPI0034022081